MTQDRLKSGGQINAPWSTAVIATGMIGVGVVSMAALSGPPLIRFTAALMYGAVLAGTISLAPPFPRKLAWMIGLGWGGLLGLAMVEATFGDQTLANWVEPAELACLTAAGATLASHRVARYERWTELALVVAASLMLLLFGLVHVTRVADIANMVPPWIHGRTMVPYLTGTTLIVAAALILPQVSRRPAALTIAAMFASWVPLVHAGRIAAHPGNLFEWRFALMAVALCGSLLLLVGASPRRHNVGHRYEQSRT